jgi:hypothetical protein
MCCLEYARIGRLVKTAQPPQADTLTRAATAAWGCMGGKLDWQALPWVAEWLEISDLDGLVHLLLILKEHRGQ